MESGAKENGVTDGSATLNGRAVTPDAECPGETLITASSRGGGVVEEDGASGNSCMPPDCSDGGLGVALGGAGIGQISISESNSDVDMRSASDRAGKISSTSSPAVGTARCAQDPSPTMVRNDKRVREGGFGAFAQPPQGEPASGWGADIGGGSANERDQHISQLIEYVDVEVRCPNCRRYWEEKQVGFRVIS